MQVRVVKIKARGSKALYFAAFLAACWSLVLSPSLPTSPLNPFSSPSHAQTKMALESLDSLKRNAGSYKGSVEVQKRIGDIYLKKFEPAFYQGQLFSSTELNAVEAYVWYALVVARSDHKQILQKPMALDPNIQPENFSGRDLATINEAKTGFNRLKAQARFKKGAAGWAAERKFVEHYEESPIAAYYILGEMYGSGLYILRQDYFEAYAYMRVAELAGFPDASARAAHYLGYITFNQKDIAERKAQTLFANHYGQGAGGIAYSGGTYTSGGIANSGSAIGSGSGWGPDFQTNRRHRDAGSTAANTPVGVDAHHLATSHFNQGNSFLATGRVEDAKVSYEAAISAEPTSLAAFNASRQLQALTLTCSLRDDRIRRMVRPANRKRVESGISWERIQIALKALGHYPDMVDGKPDLKTRRAIRSFQRDDLNVDETGYLTTDQRVELICAAAQDVRDADSQIQLGIMYARGIGLNCNTAAAHGWFQRAADQGHPTALYNLGLMYMEGFYDRQAPGDYPPGTREYLSGAGGPQSSALSIRPRKIRDFDVARYFFEEAKSKGHPDADDRVKEIKSGKAKKLLRSESIVGCIDYEAEIDITQIGTEAADLDVRVAAVAGQISSANAPTSACTALKKLKKESKGLTNRADEYYSYFKEKQYTEEAGQSNEDRINSSFTETRNLLGDIKTKITDAEKSCSAS